MKDLKIIAIRPLTNCDKKFCKVLKENEIYKFYNDYEFILSENKKDVLNVKYSSTVPNNLYKSKNNFHDFHLNISAIVGKNGSGKSTLTELLFVAIYNLAVEKGILENVNQKKLQLVENIKVEIFYALDDNIYCLDVNTDSNKNGKIQFDINLKSININDKKIDRRFKILNILDNFKSLFYESFFYTIAINYSVYSLNSIHIGNRIDALFHKNDGYQTKNNPIALKNTFKLFVSFLKEADLISGETRVIDGFLAVAKTQFPVKTNFMGKVTCVQK